MQCAHGFGLEGSRAATLIVVLATWHFAYTDLLTLTMRLSAWQHCCPRTVRVEYSTLQPPPAVRGTHLVPCH